MPAYKRRTAELTEKLGVLCVSTQTGFLFAQHKK
jgi:hypothetical protein